MSRASVGWYPTADGIRPSKADTSDPAWVKLKHISLCRRHVLENYIPEDVVDEEKHILSFFVSEIPKSNGKSQQLS